MTDVPGNCVAQLGSDEMKPPFHAVAPFPQAE